MLVCYWRETRGLLASEKKAKLVTLSELPTSLPEAALGRPSERPTGPVSRAKGQLPLLTERRGQPPLYHEREPTSPGTKSERPTFLVTTSESQLPLVPRAKGQPSLSPRAKSRGLQFTTRRGSRLGWSVDGSIAVAPGLPPLPDRPTGAGRSGMLVSSIAEVLGARMNCRPLDLARDDKIGGNERGTRVTRGARSG